MRRGRFDFREKTILTAPVIVLTDEGHVQARYLNATSTEAEIKRFMLDYQLTEQQKWCDTVLEERIPI